MWIIQLSDIYKLINICSERRQEYDLDGSCEEYLSTHNCFGEDSKCDLKLWWAPLIPKEKDFNYTGIAVKDYDLRKVFKPVELRAKLIVVPICHCGRNRDGAFCEIEKVHPCEKEDTCSGKGTCVPLHAHHFNCNCSEGFFGVKCEREDPCHSKPCRWPGSTCIRKEIGESLFVQYTYDCICPNADAHARACQNSITGVCRGVNCTNGGHCAVCKDDDEACNEFELKKGFRCICPIGHNGLMCEKETNACDFNHCQKNSTCQINPQNPLDYECICKPGYTGKLCRLLTDWCAYKGTSLCGENGVCRQTNSSANHFICNCSRNYTGLHCAELIESSIKEWYQRNYVYTYPASSMAILIPITIIFMIIKDFINRRKSVFLRKVNCKVEAESNQRTNEEIDYQSSIETNKISEKH
uniref:EGF-like domain-containing protein n=1 Tax=Rhabditophanes sp. KR3021 TaxID=114890 RepID=A0AC35TJM3_9BILA